MTDKDSSLLPCPFCGGEAYLCRVGNAHTKERGCNIGCNDCHFQKNFRVIRNTLEWCEAESIKWWNTRAGAAYQAAQPMQDAVSIVSRLKDIITSYRRGENLHETALAIIELFQKQPVQKGLSLKVFNQTEQPVLITENDARQIINAATDIIGDKVDAEVKVTFTPLQGQPVQVSEEVVERVARAIAKTEGYEEVFYVVSNFIPAAQAAITAYEGELLKERDRYKQIYEELRAEKDENNTVFEIMKAASEKTFKMMDDARAEMHKKYPDMFPNAKPEVK